jgi:hypothetical protein
MKNYIYSNNLILNRVLIGISFFSVLSLKLLKLSTRIIIFEFLGLERPKIECTVLNKTLRSTNY